MFDYECFRNGWCLKEVVVGCWRRVAQSGGLIIQRMNL